MSLERSVEEGIDKPGISEHTHDSGSDWIVLVVLDSFLIDLLLWSSTKQLQ